MTEIIKSSPAVAVSSLGLAGFTLHDGVLIATLIYIGLQIIVITPKVYTASKEILKKITRRKS